MAKAHTSFKFRHFSILHGDGVWKVGTDSVLLGSWTRFHKSPELLLDMGTGSAILSLMLAQRYPDLTIDAADIVPQALEIASENVRRSKWAQRIHLSAQDLTEINGEWIGRYGAIICNPPYFPEGMISSIESRRSSRQGIGFCLWDVPSLAHQYLKKGGALSVVIPFSSTYAFIEKANAHGLYVWRRLNVRHRDTTPISAVLLYLTHGRSKAVHSHLTLYDIYNQPTADYSALCEDYLSF